MRNTRLVLATTGTLTTLTGLAILWPTLTHTTPPRHATHCTRDPAIRVIHICGPNVYITNPDGTRIYIGHTTALRTPQGHPLANPTR